MPLAHIVAYCGDIGLGAKPGAAMLSLQLAAGVAAQQLWGWIADHLGGLRTVLFASTGMAAAMTGFLLTQNEIGLFSVSAVFGLAFGGLVPGYILAVRKIFPAAEATWRIPIVLFPGALGMAAGGWLAGAIYDRFGFYAPAFAVGLMFNLLNLAVVHLSHWRQRYRGQNLSTTALKSENLSMTTFNCECQAFTAGSACHAVAACSCSSRRPCSFHARTSRVRKESSSMPHASRNSRPAGLFATVLAAVFAPFRQFAPIA